MIPVPDNKRFCRHSVELEALNSLGEMLDMKAFNLTFPVIAIAAAISIVPGQILGETKEISIGTAGAKGFYYRAGQAICQIVNRRQSEHNIKCETQGTPGSIYNLNAIRAGQFDLGLAQSDWQHDAYFGRGPFAKAGPDEDLRALFSIHMEQFTVVARRNAGLRSFADLKGKRVSLGNPGSGQRGTMQVVMSALGWKMSDFKQVRDLKSAEAAGALCNNAIDAFVLTTVHPNEIVKKAIEACDAVLIPVGGSVIDRLVSETPYYFESEIAPGLYKKHEGSITTFGVKGTVVTSKNLDLDIAYWVVKSVFEKLDLLRRQHEAYEGLQVDDMRTGNTAPVHAGAQRFFQEADMLRK